MKITLLFLLCILFSLVVTGQVKEDIAKSVIDLEKSVLDRWIKGDPLGFVEIAADEITYIDPFLERRIDGLEAFSQRMQGIVGKIYSDRYELLNPVVQGDDDVAVLSFNFVSYTSRDGKTNESRWNATETYKRINETWKLIHSHWSLTVPDLK